MTTPSKASDIALGFDNISAKIRIGDGTFTRFEIDSKDPLHLVGGNNININYDSITKRVIFASTGGGTGGGGNSGTSSAGGIYPSLIESGDIHWNKTRLYINGDNTIVDSSQYAVNLVTAGTVAPTELKNVFGGKSLAFNGGGDFISFTNNTEFDFRNDFSIEFWFQKRNSNTHTILSVDGQAGTHAGHSIFVSNTGQLVASFAKNSNKTQTLQIIGATALVNDTWYFCSIDKIANDYAIYINGESDGSLTSAEVLAAPVSGRPAFIGRKHDGSDELSGFIDDIRITIGAYRHQFNYSIPRSAFVTGPYTPGSGYSSLQYNVLGATAGDENLLWDPALKSLKVGGEVISSSLLISKSTGVEGGQINLQRPDIPTGSTPIKDWNIVLDSYKRVFRIFGFTDFSAAKIPFLANFDTGNIAIGGHTELPSEALDVFGNIKLSGLIRFNDGTTMSTVPTMPSLTWANISGKPSFSTVATSGDYNSLINKPAIPAQYVLPAATISTLGGIKPGSGLTIEADGTLTMSSSVGITGNLNDLDDVVISTPASGQVISHNGTSWINATPSVAAANVTGLAAVATSGAYSSLSGRPSFSTVATSGSYNDLTNKPAAYSLPVATASILGGVKAGNGLVIDGAGVASVDISNLTSKPGGAVNSVQYNNNNVMGGSTTIFVNNSAARLGIGTSTPTDSLHIYNSGDVYARLETVTSGGKCQFVMKRPAGDSWFGPVDTFMDFWSYENISMRFATNGLQRMTISSTGNVGIGVAAPTEKLQVDGNIKINTSGNGIIFPDNSIQRYAITPGGSITEQLPADWDDTFAMFKFNNTYADAKGNLTLLNNANTSFSSDISKFAPTSLRVDNGSLTSLPTNLMTGVPDCTIEGWVYVPTQAFPQTLHIFGFGNNTSADIYFYRNNSNGKIYCNRASALDGPICPLDQWFHVAFSKAGVSGSFYVNGILYNNVNTSVMPFENNSVLRIGGLAQPYGGASTVYVDNIIITKKRKYLTNFTTFNTDLFIPDEQNYPIQYNKNGVFSGGSLKWSEGSSTLNLEGNIKFSSNTQGITFGDGTVLKSAPDIQALPIFAAVATSGSYLDLKDKPTLEHTHTVPYDISFFLNYDLSDAANKNSIVGSYLSARTIVIPQGFTGTRTRCKLLGVPSGVAQTYVLTLRVNGIDKALLTFKEDLTYAIITSPTELTIVDNDLIELISPQTQTIIINSISITIVGNTIIG